MIRKPFDKDLFDKNDKLSRDIIKKYLPIVEDNKDRYDYDLVISHKYFKGIEVERINVWKDIDNLPFGDHTRLFERKLRYNDNILFIQLSYNLKKCCIFTKKSVNINNFRTTKYGDKSFIVNKGGCLLLKTKKININIFDVLQYIK